MLSDFLYRLRAVFKRSTVESELHDELQFHLERQVEKYKAAGASDEEARRRVRLEFGGMEQIKEQCREARGTHLFDDFRQDLRLALRMFRCSPGFTAIALAALAVGIGANTAVFSIVNGILLKSLPYKDPQQLVVMFEQLPNAPAKFGFSPPDFEIARETFKSYSGIAAYQGIGYEVSGVTQPMRVVGARVTADLFPVLGVAPHVGRWITSDDDKQASHVVVLSHGLWARAFGQDPSVVGRAITLDRQPYTVIGVMPERFEFPPRGAVLNGEPAEVFVPMSFSQVEREGFGMRYNTTVVARLKPGVRFEQARAEATTIAQSLPERYPPVLRGFAGGIAIPMNPLTEETVGGSRRMLLVLMAAVAMVLLVGCADVANLILTQSLSRQRDLAIRSALGASPSRVIRQLLTEALMLSIAGSALGLLVAYSSMQSLLYLAGKTLPRTESIGFDYRVVLFTVILALITPVLFGAMPAIRTAFRMDGEALKERGRGATPGRAHGRLVGALVVAQVALALMLSVGAGLLARSFVRLLSTDPGFRSEQVASITLTLPSGRYTNGRQVRTFYEQAIEAAREIPGTILVAIGNDLPLGVRERRAFSSDANTRPIPDVSRLIAPTWISPGYFESLGIPLKRGRLFTDADRPDTPPVVIVNQKLAQMFWPGEDPIGHRIRWGIDIPQNQSPWMTIVGVVGDVKQAALDTPTLPQVYVAVFQEPPPMFGSGSGLLRTFNLIVRSSRTSASLIADLRGVVRHLDPALPVSKAQSLTDMISDSVKPQRFSMTVVMLFASIGLGLAAIGIYGVLAKVISQQSHEIGVRMALGATAGSLVWMVLRRALILMGIGVGTGAAGALALTRFMAGLLYEIQPTDAVTFFGAAVSLAALAVVVSLIPAWRATRIDPLIALRAE